MVPVQCPRWPLVSRGVGAEHVGGHRVGKSQPHNSTWDLKTENKGKRRASLTPGSGIFPGTAV